MRGRRRVQQRPRQERRGPRPRGHRRASSSRERGRSTASSPRPRRGRRRHRPVCRTAGPRAPTPAARTPQTLSPALLKSWRWRPRRRPPRPHLRSIQAAPCLHSAPPRSPDPERAVVADRPAVAMAGSWPMKAAQSAAMPTRTGCCRPVPRPRPPPTRPQKLQVQPLRSREQSAQGHPQQRSSHLSSVRTPPRTCGNACG
mmetsp:Transcript_24512/g.77064  ORF Transcript_24512/g.77064 Transcript_24512/m.77064 type:complete len:200 (-) Transcript_24512:628-1227(-)